MLFNVKGALLGYSQGGGRIQVKGVGKKPFFYILIFFSPLCEFPQVFSHIITHYLKRESVSFFLAPLKVFLFALVLFVSLNYPSAAHRFLFSAKR